MTPPDGTQMNAQRITAYVVIGMMEPVGFEPRNWAYLVEGKRLAWFIAPPGFFSPEDESMFKSNWLTTPLTVVEDLMLGVATVVENLPFLGRDIRRATDRANGEVVDLGRLPDGCRRRLDRLNQQEKHEAQLVVTVQSGSVLLEQLSKFNRYDVLLEICTSSLVRNRSSAHKSRPLSRWFLPDHPRWN